MEFIVAVDQKWGIGFRGQLLAHVREDLQNFRRETTGKTVILGAKTLQTFPGAKPLPKRRNLVLSRRMDYKVEGAEVLHSVGEVFEALQPGEEAVVIGGATIYEQFLPYCSRAIVTRFDDVFPADAYLPDLAKAGWKCTEVSEWKMSNPETDSHPALRFRFEVWKKTRKKKKLSV